VDVKLDKWDLKPGHDSFKFMEQMVTDPAVTKVILVCDKIYQAKANKREGDVGAESQIISPEIYNKSSQDKFAAVITENDENGQACVPVFYKGRIYIDFTQDEDFEVRYESLLRWILDKPLYVRPELGSVPSHLCDLPRQHPLHNCQRHFVVNPFLFEKRVERRSAMQILFLHHDPVYQVWYALAPTLP